MKMMRFSSPIIVPLLLAGTLTLWTPAVLGKCCNVDRYNEKAEWNDVDHWMCQGRPMFTKKTADHCKTKLEDCRLGSDFCQFKLLLERYEYYDGGPTIGPVIGTHKCWGEEDSGTPTPTTDNTTCTFKDEKGYVGPHLVCSYKSHSDPNDLGKLFVPLDTSTNDFYKRLKGKEYDPKDCPGKCCSKKSEYQKEPFLVQWRHGVHDWMCQGGPMLTPSAKTKCKQESGWRYCDFCEFTLKLTPDARTDAGLTRSRPLQGSHGCWNKNEDSGATKPKPPDERTCKMKDTGELVCTYKGPDHSGDPSALGNLPIEASKAFYEKVQGREYDPKDPPCPKHEEEDQCCNVEVGWEGGVHEWMCAGAPMMTRTSKVLCNRGGVAQKCESGFCEVSLKAKNGYRSRSSDPDYDPDGNSRYRYSLQGRHGCWKESEDRNVGIDDARFRHKDDTTTCTIHDWSRELSCTYEALPNPRALGNFPLETAKEFYRKVQGKDFDPDDPPCPKPVSCYGGAGVWKSLQEWECQGGPLKPPPGSTVNDRAVMYLVTCDDDWRYEKGLCSFDITPRSAEDTNEEMNVHFWCLEKRHTALTPSATSSTPACRLQKDTDGRPIPSLRCSYKPGDDPKKTFETATVSKGAIKKFRDAVFKAKVWSDDKKGDETCVK